MFNASKKELQAIEGLEPKPIDSILQFKDFSRAEEEIEFIKKYNTTPLFLTDENYPQRLLNCYDSPPLLYFKGNADLNCSKIVAILGTRNHNDYGKKICEKLVEEVTNEDVSVVSSLAFGIDSIAHKCAVKII